MAKENTTKYAVLGLLRISPGSGYDVKKLSDMSIAHFWNENYGHIYPVLKQLKAGRLVTSEPRQSPGRPPKSVYRITEKGVRELEEWLRKPAVRHPHRIELLLKVFLTADAGAPHVREKLRQAKQEGERGLVTFSGIESMLKTNEPYRSQPSLPLWLATLDYGKRMAQAEMDWCDATLHALDRTPTVRTRKVE